MRFFRGIACSVALVLCAEGISSATGRDYCEVHGEAEPKLCSYEPTTIGYTQDNDDSWFMDFKLSVRYQLFPIGITRLQNHLHDGLGDRSALYLAFTGRFGQYIGTRDSSPVVEKLFNPKVFYRFWTDRGTHQNHVDLAFAHESNGQSIDSPEEYQAARDSARNKDEIKDQLSRGWDYWEVEWKKTLYEEPETIAARDDPRLSEVCTGVHDDVSIKQVCGKAFPNGIDLNNEPHDPRLSEICKSVQDDASVKQVCSKEFPNGIPHKDERQTSLASYLALKHFLARGPLEGRQENYNDWEDDSQGKRLDRVSGFSAMLKWIIRDEYKVAARYETGIRQTFRYNTYRLELGAKVLQLPVTLWGQSGYNSDLAQYFKKVNSYGLQAEIGSF